jgi:hypothetical protein
MEGVLATLRLLFAKVRVGECIDLQQELKNLDSIRCMLRLLAWFLAAIILIVLSIFAAVIRPTFDWRLWPAIWRARLNIKAVARKRVATAEVVSRQGATKISPGHLSFGIRTRTDRERDILCQDPDIHKEFRDALVKAGYPAETHPVVHFGIQSQETVDRDYGCSWYEASEMP